MHLELTERMSGRPLAPEHVVTRRLCLLTLTSRQRAIDRQFRLQPIIEIAAGGKVALLGTEVGSLGDHLRPLLGRNAVAERGRGLMLEGLLV